MKLGLAVALLVPALAAASFARGAEQPDYPHGDFAGDCASCHEPERWSPARIDKSWKHPDPFPLRGAHRSAPCRGCHLVLDFKKTPTACADCHRDPHRGELGIDCATCHVPTNFLDRTAQLEQHRRTRFPLTGAHVSQDCESCHPPQPQGALTWVGTPVDCQACHLALYSATTDPNHAQAGFPLDCRLCHTPTTWDRARFDHAGTSFPLTGAHRALECVQCHANGYSGTPTACNACHADPHNGQFGTDCALCHDTTDFGNADFASHDPQFFPIYSGTHANRWSDCSDCHTQPGNFAVFSCFLCHSQADTDDRHTEVSGYSYDSQRCYECHPDGRAGGRAR